MRALSALESAGTFSPPSVAVLTFATQKSLVTFIVFLSIWMLLFELALFHEQKVSKMNKRRVPLFCILVIFAVKPVNELGKTYLMN